jgi:hypothetical protein
VLVSQVSSTKEIEMNQTAKQPDGPRARAATATKVTIIPCGAMHADLAWLLL